MCSSCSICGSRLRKQPWQCRASERWRSASMSLCDVFSQNVCSPETVEKSEWSWLAAWATFVTKKQIATSNNATRPRTRVPNTMRKTAIWLIIIIIFRRLEHMVCQRVRCEPRSWSSIAFMGDARAQERSQPRAYAQAPPQLVAIAKSHTRPALSLARNVALSRFSLRPARARNQG